MHFMVLCICPLISLMMDQCRRLQSMGLTADFMGSAQEDNKAVALKRFLTTRWREKCSSPVYQRYLAAVVIDEAHCISNCLVPYTCIINYYYTEILTCPSTMTFTLPLSRADVFRPEYKKLGILRSLVCPEVRLLLWQPLQVYRQRTSWLVVASRTP